jgi:hypothetical protein
MTGPDRIMAAGSTSITVNANGNTTAKGSDTFTYDQSNRLKTANVSGTTETDVLDFLDEHLDVFPPESSDVGRQCVGGQVVGKLLDCAAVGEDRVRADVLGAETAPEAARLAPRSPLVATIPALAA